ncbi:hypothetical protein SAMN03097699_2850 [Flavobacteriaceae bacterium MAR_2010_188]|nr:hypothetical protein SAMN03097699_2850 [Flavobacteriaceae bacterium MAR_2010_188]
MLRQFLALIFFVPTIASSQDYIDVFKVGLNHNFSSYFENTDFTTTVNYIDASFLTGTKRFATDGFHVGGDFYYYKVQMFPNSEPADLYSTTLVLSYTAELSDRTTGIFTLLPKLASDYDVISLKDVYLGGSVIIKNHQSRRLHYRYGVYGSYEAFGLLTTPTVGLYYMSDDNDFEADITLPLSADIRFQLKYFSLGIEYAGTNRSFRVYDYKADDVYAEQRRLEFGGYFRLRTPNPNTWLKAKLGYAFNSLAVYNVRDKIDFYFIDFVLRNDRTQLNPDLRGSLFFKVELLYRFPY